MPGDSDVMGFREAARFLSAYNTNVLPMEIRRQLSGVVARMRLDTNILSTTVCGALVERDGEGNLRVWVDPSLWKRGT
jgi:hypothetical protein